MIEGYYILRLLFTLPVRDLGNNINPSFQQFHPFIFIVIHRNTILGVGGLPPFITVNLTHISLTISCNYQIWQIPYR